MPISNSWNHNIILQNLIYQLLQFMTLQSPFVVTRPVGTILVLVRRVRANNLLSMKAERLTAWGQTRDPLKGPWRGPGAEPRRGSRGQRPRKLLGLSICKRPRKALLEIFFSLNQPTSAWYRNVSVKWHSSLCRVNFRPLGTAPNPNWVCFEHYLKIINYFEKMIWLSWSKLSEKVQKWHSNFVRSSVSWVIDWTMQNNFCI